MPLEKMKFDFDPNGFGKLGMWGWDGGHKPLRLSSSKFIQMYCMLVCVGEVYVSVCVCTYVCERFRKQNKEHFSSV